MSKQSKRKQQRALMRALQRVPAATNAGLDKASPTVTPTGGSNQLTRRLQMTAVSFQGPIPPPEMLARYNEVAPNGADRILTMAEQQNSHRLYIEKQVISANIVSENRGQWLGFIITMTAILGGVYLIAIGKNVEGLVAIVGSLVALAGVFVFGKIAQKKELAQKAESLPRKK